MAIPIDDDEPHTHKCVVLPPLFLNKNAGSVKSQLD
jgi:hypothetical protein